MKKRVLSLALALAMILFAFPVTVTPAQALVSLSYDFEDGTEQGWTNRNRGDDDRDSTVVKATQEAAHGGVWSLKVTGRGQGGADRGWNAPKIDITDKLTAGSEYEISAWVKVINGGGELILSTEVWVAGAPSYNNLQKRQTAVADGWVELKGTYRFDNLEDVSIYVETANAFATGEFYLDDVKVIEVDGSGLKPDLSLPSLAETYKGKFNIGTAVASEQLGGLTFDFIKHHFNIITFGNAMKPDAIAPTKDNFQWERIDPMVDMLLEAGLKIHGHTLAWHTNQSPDWLNAGLTRAQAIENLKLYVSNTAGHFKGKITSWDVVNEAFMDSIKNDDWKKVLRSADSKWYTAFANGADESKGESGADYIEMFFREARAADPDAVLYYNEYNLDYADKIDAVCAMVKEINDKWLAEGNTRLLIEGVGMQSHYQLDGENATQLANVETTINKLIDLGVEISITELDVNVNEAANDALSESQAEMQANFYANLFLLYDKYADHISRVTLWGIDDLSSWRATGFPLLFNSDLSAKAAYYAVSDPVKQLGVKNFKTAEVTYGTPAIDGKGSSAVWDINDPRLSDPAKPFITADSSLPVLAAYPGGTVKLLWDESNLYVLGTIKDATTDSNDAINIFVDENTYEDGKKGDAYNDNVRHISLNAEGKVTGDAEGKVTYTDGAYTYEIKIPFKTIKAEGAATFGFDVRFDDYADGKLVGGSAWNDSANQSDTSPAGWGEAMLFAKRAGTATNPSPSAPPAATAEPKKGGCGGGKTTTPSAVVFFGIIAAVAAVKIKFFK